MVVLVEEAAGDGGVRTLETGGEHGAPLAFSWGCVQVAPPTRPLGNLADRCLAFWTRRPGLAHQVGVGGTLPLSGDLTVTCGPGGGVIALREATHGHSCAV